ncbi:MAG: thermopsin [Thermoplasmatales archaeon]|nr:thermopsin [Thermoplasmatales archaeon]
MNGLCFPIKKMVSLLFVIAITLVAVFATSANVGVGAFQTLTEPVHCICPLMNNSSPESSSLDTEGSMTAINHFKSNLIPFPPLYFNTNDSLEGSKLFFYSGEPAPMGIVDYGLSTPVPSALSYNAYSYSTSEFMGKVTINSLLTKGNRSVGNSMSIQLNSMLVFNNSGKQFDYWVQDIALLDTYSKYVSFEDNIWNSSWPGSGIYATSLSGNGTIYSGGISFYVSSSSMQGSMIRLNYPATISLEVTSFETLSNQPAVSFRYNDGYGWQEYDTVIFKFAHAAKNDGFLVDGNMMTPARQDYDAELVLGGPGHGYTTSDVSSNVSLQLEFWNGFNLQSAKNAFNFGSDTSETISNTSVSEEHFISNGALYTKVSNGEEVLSELYDQQDVSTLTISNLIPKGDVIIGGQNYNFTDGNLVLTLWPGNYSVKFIANFLGVHTYWNSSITLSLGENLNISPIYSTIYKAMIIVFVLVIAIITLILIITIRKRNR